MALDLGAREAAQQIAQQVAEQVGQAVSQAIQKFLQTQGSQTGASTTGTGVFTREELGDIGGTEGIESDLITDRGVLFSNKKRTYDEYQHESLESIRRNRSYVDKILADAKEHDKAKENVALQALQNAVETANMIGKQAVRHGDIAIDGHWNPVQQGAADTLTARAVSIDDASLKAIGAAVAAALANAINPKQA